MKASSLLSGVIILAFVWPPIALLGPFLSFLCWLVDVKLVVLDISFTLFSVAAVPKHQSIPLLIANLGGIAAGIFFYFRSRRAPSWI